MYIQFTRHGNVKSVQSRRPTVTSPTVEPHCVVTYVAVAYNVLITNSLLCYSIRISIC